MCKFVLCMYHHISPACTATHWKHGRASLFLAQITEEVQWQCVRPLGQPPPLQVWLCSYTKSGNCLAFESCLVVRKHTACRAHIQGRASIHKTGHFSTTHATLTSTWIQHIFDILWNTHIIIIFNSYYPCAFIYIFNVDHLRFLLYLCKRGLSLQFISLSMNWINIQSNHSHIR